MCSGACCSRAAVIAHGSYLPSAETFPLCSGGGEGKHKRLCLLSHSLPPSPSHWRSFGGSLCNKRCKIRASILMHLEPFCVRVAGIRAKSNITIAQPPELPGNAQFCNCTAKILRSTYMMGQGWQSKAPNLDQCEPLRENALPA